MVTVLLFIIYIAFIGLGIPDSLFGTAWPAIYAEFGLPISYASFVTVIISCGTVASSMASARVIRHFGTGKISFLSTAMTAAALWGFSCSQNLFWMCLFAVPLGLGAGAIDTALNNYVAIHYSAAHMSFLHCFYGIGVSVSPYILSLVISGRHGWQDGYRIACLFQLCIALLLLFTLPLWKLAHAGPTKNDAPISHPLTFKQIAKLPGIRLMWCLFLTSCAIEYTCGGWGATFLVESRQMPPQHAARMVMYYYAGMALGRFLSGLLATRMDSFRIIQIAQSVLGIAILFLLLPLPAVFAAIALFLTGLGNGPLFPNFNYLTPHNFGKEASPAVMGTQMAASYIGIMLAPAACGILGQRCGMGVFPFYVLAYYAVMILTSHKAKKLFSRH